jgi:hypothetical protein
LDCTLSLPPTIRAQREIPGTAGELCAGSGPHHTYPEGRVGSHMAIGGFDPVGSRDTISIAQGSCTSRTSGRTSRRASNVESWTSWRPPGRPVPDPWRRRPPDGRYHPHAGGKWPPGPIRDRTGHSHRRSDSGTRPRPDSRGAQESRVRSGVRASEGLILTSGRYL